MALKFVEAGDAVVPTEDFVAAWLTLVIQHGDKTQTIDQAIEIRAEAISFDQLVAKGRGGSLEALCRCLAPNAPSNTMMATSRMLAINENIIEVDRSTEPFTARLTGAAWNTWHEVSPRKQNVLLVNALQILRPTLLG